MVLQDHGKCMLIKILSLLLSLVLRRQLETPPTTPHPGRFPPPCPTNGHHLPGDTAEKRLALQPPPGGKRNDKEKEKKPLGDEKADQGPEAPSSGEGGEPTDPPPEEPPNPPSGEGEVEGGPLPGPDQGRGPEQEALLQGVASRLTKWEQQFDRLVDSIVGDLRNYWMQLKTPQ
ncbi:E4 [Betapapillomavirus 2]|uniref:E4 n=1 Tax=Betapapillomavirus 2 TaxID=333924 RepID=A0A2D2AL13_9PAPI|nr:E4 [Betapapillomavirus 2]